TERLASIAGKPDVRASLGVPYQTASLTRKEVVGHHDMATYGAKTETLPMPEGQLRRVGDPDGSNSDRQAFLVDEDRELYYEVSNIIPASPAVKAGYGIAAWWEGIFGRKVDTSFTKTVDRVSVFDLDKPWDAVKMNGTAAIKVPMLPMTPTFDELERGHVGHAVQFCATHYQPKTLTGYARGSDGKTASSPLVAGMVLRLTQRRFEQLVELWEHRPHVVALLRCVREFGMVVADRTDPKAGHLLRIAQDPRIDLVGLHLVITDFEVVQLTN
ncbi:MAG: hypothetical protein M3Y51_04900, partial [Actinomycetota bacterium]|nr:hypothetical protein [Actinomycetota bacterium]